MVEFIKIEIFFIRLICIGFGALALPCSLITKLFKEELCCEFGSKEIDPLTTESKVIQIR
jgi:hypothetical protein